MPLNASRGNRCILYDNRTGLLKFHIKVLKMLILYLSSTINKLTIMEELKQRILKDGKAKKYGKE